MIENISKFGPEELDSLNKKIKWIRLILLLVFSVICLIPVMLGVMSDEPILKSFLITIGIVSPLLFYAREFAYIRKSKKWRHSGYEICTVRSMFEDEFFVTEFVRGQIVSRTQFPYSIIAGVKETNEAVRLIVNRTEHIYLKKSGFTQGTSEQLKDYLLSKGVKWEGSRRSRFGTTNE